MSKRFQFVNLFWSVSIPGALLLIFLVVFYPSALPLSQLGALGEFLLNYRTVWTVVLLATIVAHGYEAVVARRLCQKIKLDSQTTLLWMIQTFILGLPSLILLRKLARERR